jgi:hypothetical protein
MGPPPPKRPVLPGAYKYAEEILLRDVEHQGNVASYYSNGALTAVTVLLAAFSLLYGVASQHVHVPGTVPVYWAVFIVLVSGGLLGTSWVMAGVDAGPDPTQIVGDLVVKGIPEATVRQGVIRGLVVTHGSNRTSLAWSKVLLATAIPLGILGIWLFIYATGA